MSHYHTTLPTIRALSQAHHDPYDPSQALQLQRSTCSIFQHAEHAPHSTAVPVWKYTLISASRRLLLRSATSLMA